MALENFEETRFTRTFHSSNYNFHYRLENPHNMQLTVVHLRYALT